MRYVDTALDATGEDALCAWLDRTLSTAATLTLRSGFYSRKGIEAVRRRLERLLAGGGEVLAVVGGDLLQDDPAGLRALWEIHQTFPDRARFHVSAGTAFMNAKTYHVEHVDRRCSAWVGSANLTFGGLAANFEAAITLDSCDDDPALLESVRAATHTAARRPRAVPLNREVLTAREVPPQTPSGPELGRPMGPPLAAVTGHGSGLLDRLATGTVTGTTDGIGAVMGAGVVSTGLHALDRALQGGLRPGALTVLAGRDGDNLGVLALNIAMRVAAGAGRPVSLHTFTTPRTETASHIISATTMIEHRILHRTDGRPRPTLAVSAAFRRLAATPLKIHIEGAALLGALVDAVNRTAERAGSEFVVVDPATALRTGRPGPDGPAGQAIVLQGLKDLAMALRLPVLATVDLGRAVAADNPPEHVTASGVGPYLGQVADVVVLLHGRRGIRRRKPRGVEVLLHVVKNRYGPRSTVTLLQRPEVSRFEDIPR